MLRRSTGGLLALAAALAFPLLSASPGLAADTAGPAVQITSPDEFAAGQQDNVTVDVHAGAPVPDNTWVTLSIFFPHRLTAVSTQVSGLVCNVSSPQDVECAGVASFSDGSVAVTVNPGPGDDITDTIQAFLQVGDADPVSTSKDVHIAGTPSGLDVQIDAPDQIRPGTPATITVTASTDHPVTDSVSVSVDLQSDRLTAVSVTAPGFDCTVRPRQDFGGGSFAASGADCVGSGLADSVTVTLTATADPGAGEFGSIDAGVRVVDSSASQTADIIVLGSDTATISGRVWNDLDRDGRQDPGEPGIAGIEVGSLPTSTVTGADGRYELDDVDRGDTALFFGAPGRFEFTKANVGDDTQDSDVTTSTRECDDCVVGSLTLTLTGPTTVDAGLFDPKVAPPHGGTTPAPTKPIKPTKPTAPTVPAPQAGTVPHTLASTGVPVAGLTGIGVLLLAVGIAATLYTRRRSVSDQS